MSKVRFRIILVILIALIVYLLGNNQTALWDRDEPRYAQTSRQMLKSGDWVVPHLLDQVRTAKPVLIYWCQAAAMKVLGDNDFAARFPSSLAMVGTLIVLGIVIYLMIGARRAMWTVFILSTSALAIAAAKMCLTDAVLLLFLTVSQVCLAIIYTRYHDVLPSLPPGMRWAQDVLTYGSGPIPKQPRMMLVPVILWIAIGLAGLTKGPVVIGISLTTMITLALMDLRDRRVGFFPRRIIGWWGQTRPLLGIVIVAIICGPWLILIHHREPSFLPAIIGHDLVERAHTGLEGHKGPPGYYLLLIWGIFFPWSLLLPATAVQAWKRRHLPVVRFAIAGVVGPWIMFEIVQTKLPHYLLPIFPMLAFLTADMLIRAGRKAHNELSNPAFPKIVLGWGVIVILAASIPWISLKYFPHQVDSTAIWSMLILSIFAIEYARQIYVYFKAKLPLDAAAIMGVGMLLFVVVLYTQLFPHAQFLRTSPRVAQVLHEQRAQQPVMIEYKEDSLPWYEGGSIRGRRNNEFLIRTNPSDWPEWIVLTNDVWQQLPSDLQKQLEVVDTIHGWAYSDGNRIVDVMIVRKKVN